MEHKQISIRCCGQCPHGKTTEYISGFTTFYCHKIEQEIYIETAYTGFPKNCPLPNINESIKTGE
jgi:hypothetical protein